MAMRVYELAKKLGMENRVLIPELKKMGVPVTSHSSALDDEIVEKVLGKLAPQSKGQGAATEADSPSKSIPGAAQSKGQPTEESAKPDKRRILIKRKKEEEPAEILSSSTAVEIEHSAQPELVVATSTDPSPPAEQSVIEEPVAPSPRVEDIRPESIVAPPAAVVPSAVVPTQEAAQSKPVVAPPGAAGCRQE